MRGKFVEILKKNAIGGVFQVVVGNFALLFSKIIIWLCVPKILGVTEYGYYKIFTLYLVYATMLHFGFPDGVLLLHGGQDYRELNKSEFRMNTRFFIIFQLLISVTVIVGTVLFCKGIYRYIFCMIGIDALLVNLATYYKFISQAVMRFKELAIRNVMQAGMQVLAIVLLIILSKANVISANGYTYILSAVIIDAILLIWYIITYKDITFGKTIPLKEQVGQIKKYFSVGILLTIAFQVSHLVFILDSQMVEVLFDVKTYSIYAFAYSITNMITMVISAIATVMFPSLKKLENDDAITKFSFLMSVISVIVFFLIIVYYPLIYFIEFFLPEYVEAFSYLEIIMPGLAVSSCINMVIFTYYKILKELKQYLGISIVMLMIGAIMNYCGYLLFRVPVVFSIASIITLLLWYLMAEKFFIKKYRIKWLKNFIYICVQILIFYLINMTINNNWCAMLTYLITYMLVTMIFYNQYFIKKIQKIYHLGQRITKSKKS